MRYGAACGETTDVGARNDRIDTRRPLGQLSAVNRKPRVQAAAKIIKRNLKAQAVRIWDVSAKDITIWSEAYLQAHRAELVAAANEVVRWGRT